MSLFRLHCMRRLMSVEFSGRANIVFMSVFHCMRRLMSVEYSGRANTVFISVCRGFACTVCVDSSV